MASNTRKLIASAHASVDELAAANPELLEALTMILAGLMATETAVVVPAAKKGTKKASVSQSLDDDDDDDNDDNGDDEGDEDADESDDDDDNSDDDDDDDADLATLKKPASKGKAASTKTTKAPAKAAASTKGGKADLKALSKKRAPEPEPEEDEEEADENGDDAAAVDVAELTADGITEAFEGITEELETHERVSGGIKELSAFIDDMGYDVDGVLGMYKAKTTAEKKAALTTFASNIEHTIDAINAYELSDIVALVAELTGDDDYKPKGRAAADKELNAARDAFRAVVAAE